MLCLALVLGAAAPAGAQSQPAAEGSAADPDPAQAEILRARLLTRLGRFEEARAAFRALLARSDDHALRQEYAEALVEMGLTEEAVDEVEALLRQAPRSPKLRRLRARLDLLRGRPRLAAEQLEALAREGPEEAGQAAERADAWLRSGSWTRALSLYASLVERDPENDSLRRAYRDIRVAHVSRIEGSHATLLQVAATHHTDEVAWRAWLADRLWVRAGVRHAIYTQDTLPGLRGFTEEIETALVLVGFQPTPRLQARVGLEEAYRAERLRTTLRLGGSFDDGRSTTATLDLVAREVLTNPVPAIPLRGTTDRLTAEVFRRVADRVTLGAHYEHRHYRVSGDTLGNAWDLAGRLEVELLRGGVQLALIPQFFLSEYKPEAGSPLREQISFIRRQDVIASGILIGFDLLPGVRAQIGAVGRRDLHRTLTTWEVTGDGRWRIHPRLELHVLYTRNTGGSAVGGKEESVTGALTFLY